MHYIALYESFFLLFFSGPSVGIIVIIFFFSVNTTRKVPRPFSHNPRPVKNILRALAAESSSPPGRDQSVTKIIISYKILKYYV